MKESEFLDQVLQLARLRGWLSAHFRPARTASGWRTAVSGDGKGWPDLVLVRGETLIAAELKVGRNRPSSEQRLWLAALAEAGVATFLWTPDDWPGIERTLE